MVGSSKRNGESGRERSRATDRSSSARSVAVSDQAILLVIIHHLSRHDPSAANEIPLSLSCLSGDKLLNLEWERLVPSMTGTLSGNYLQFHVTEFLYELSYADLLVHSPMRRVKLCNDGGRDRAR